MLHNTGELLTLNRAGLMIQTPFDWSFQMTSPNTT